MHRTPGAQAIKRAIKAIIASADNAILEEETKVV
jgi:hypothetical protein